MKGRRRRGPFIFTLTETGSKEGVLIVTIPVG
jgi:hypothetical protein